MVNVVQAALEGPPGPESSGQSPCTGELFSPGHSETTETGLFCSRQPNEISSSITVTYLACLLAPSKSDVFFFFFLTKSFQTPGPEARLSVGHKGLRPRTSAGLSKILPPPMCLPSKSRLPSFFLWGHCRASIYYVFSIEHIKTFQVHEMFLTACISNSLAGLSKSFLIQSLPFASLFCCSLKHTPSSGILNYVVFLRHVLIYTGLLDFEHRRLLQ